MRADGRSTKVTLSRRYHFVASHRLHTEALDAAQNVTAFGKCNNPHGHGHNYTVEVAFSGAVEPETGMVTNLADLDRFAEEHLLQRFDHTNLNTMECFRDRVPTTENLVLEIASIFRRYPGAQLERLRIEETSNNSFEVSESVPGQSGTVNERSL